ncbi:MAG: hypothetical protein ABF335_09360 [Alphaproteobacteria bacterium]
MSFWHQSSKNLRRVRHEPVVLSLGLLGFSMIVSWVGPDAFAFIPGAQYSYVIAIPLLTWAVIQTSDRHASTRRHRLMSLGIHSVTVILMFASVYFNGGMSCMGSDQPSFMQALYLSASNFTTLGSATCTLPAGSIEQLSEPVESMMGLILLGVFISVASSKQ